MTCIRGSFVPLMVTTLLVLGCDDGGERERDVVPNGASARCTVERVQAASTDVTPLGISAASAREQVRGLRRGTLAWADGSTTRIDVAFADQDAYYATSKPNASGTDDPNIAASCRARLVVSGTLTITTADGRLNERIESVSLESVDAHSFGGSTRGIATGELGGSYPVADAASCLLAIDFDLAITGDSFSGAVHEQVSNRRCAQRQDDAAVSERIVGTW